MNSFRSSGRRIVRDPESDRVTTAHFAVSLPETASGASSSVAERVEAARREGYEQGYRDAAADVAASAEGRRRVQLSELAGRLAAAADGIASQRLGAVAVAESEIVALAVELAETLVRRELEITATAGVDAVRRALQLVPVDADLVVRLHPDDRVLVEELQALVPDRSVRLVTDPDVERGGCLVDAGPCHIDTQIGPAVTRARQLLQTWGPAASEEDDPSTTGSSPASDGASGGASDAGPTLPGTSSTGAVAA